MFPNDCLQTYLHKRFFLAASFTIDKVRYCTIKKFCRSLHLIQAKKIYIYNCRILLWLIAGKLSQVVQHHYTDLYSRSKLELNLKKVNSSDAKNFRLCFYLSFFALKLQVLKLEYCQINLEWNIFIYRYKLAVNWQNFAQLQLKFTFRIRPLIFLEMISVQLWSNNRKK